MSASPDAVRCHSKADDCARHGLQSTIYGLWALSGFALLVFMGFHWLAIAALIPVGLFARSAHMFDQIEQDLRQLAREYDEHHARALRLDRLQGAILLHYSLPRAAISAEA